MAHPPLVDQAIAASLIVSGAYLTDGVHLFRVSGLLGSGQSPSVALEDCRTLQLILCQPEELVEASLELVRGSSSGLAV